MKDVNFASIKMKCICHRIGVIPDFLSSQIFSIPHFASPFLPSYIKSFFYLSPAGYSEIKLLPAFIRKRPLWWRECPYRLPPVQP